MKSRGLRRFEGRTVVIHNAPGASLRGILVHAYKDCLVLLQGHSLDDNADLAGQIVVPRAPGLFLQVVTPEPAP